MKMLLSLILAITASISAQVPATIWTRTFGGSKSDIGFSGQQTSDGGYIIAGRTGSYGVHYEDAWLIKTESTGIITWEKTFGAAYNSNDYARSVEQTDDMGYILTGGTYTFTSGLGYDVWLIKTDASGDTLWTRTFGGSSWDVGKEVQQTADGGYIIAGETSSYGEGGYDIWLIRTDSTGDTLWTKTYGGIDDDFGSSVDQTADGGYIITGCVGYDWTANESNLWLIKTDSSGDTLWTKTYGVVDNNRGRSVQETSDGGYIIAGYTESYGAGEEDVWLIKTDSAGETLWTKTFGGAFDDGADCVRQTDDNGYIITGYTESYGAGEEDVWLIRTDSSGDVMWTKTIGGNQVDSGNSAQQTSDGGYIVIGNTASYGAGMYDAWLIKTAPDPSNIEGENLSSVNGNNILAQNSPNPFNSITTIPFTLSASANVRIEMYNLAGRQVAVLLDEWKTAGHHSIVFDRTDLSSGVYLYCLNAGDFQQFLRMMIL